MNLLRQYTDVSLSRKLLNSGSFWNPIWLPWWPFFFFFI